MKYSKAKDARRRARNAAQKPGAVQVIPDKRTEPEDCPYCMERGCDWTCIMEYDEEYDEEDS